MIKTVRDLIEKLSEFNPSAELDIDVSWYYRGNFAHAHRDRSKHKGGIELYVSEDEPGIVCIANMNPEDMDTYD